MTKLRFDPAETLRCAEHALAAPEHRQTYVENMDKIKAKPALHFVKDDGIYIMSNGTPRDAVTIPGLEHQADQDSTRCFVAYAKGYDPRTDDVWDKCRDAVGGDDFVESFKLTPVLVEDLRAGATLILDVNKTHMKVRTSLPAKVKRGVKA